MSKNHKHVKKVLKYLCKAGLYAKAEKCKFHSKSVEFLEYILFLSSLIISNDKIKVIQDWLEPKKVKDIQFFLGFVNFYYWFIFNYLDIIILLHASPRKTSPGSLISSIVMFSTLLRRHYFHFHPHVLDLQC